MKKRNEKRIKRHKRIRRLIFGTERKPRLCIYRSLSNMQAQIVDDINEKTLLSVSTNAKGFKKKMVYGGNAKAATLLGEVLAEQAKNKGITQVVFDRGGCAYHGRVKALAESARKGGLKF